MCPPSALVRRVAPAPEQAALAVFGAARAPHFFTLAELRALPQTTVRATLICAAAPFDPRRWETRDWTGVALGDLLHAVEPQAGARALEAASADGRVQAYPLAALDSALLALAADGEALAPALGGPFRLIVPGLSACDMPGAVQRLALTTKTAAAPSPTGPFAIIDRLTALDRQTRLTGQAFATDAVVLRLDDGPAVRVTVDSSGEGVAGAWAVDWPGRLSEGQTFTVEPWDADAPLVGEVRPLARRWKPRAQRLTVKRETGR